MRGAAAFVDRGRWTKHKCGSPSVIDAKFRYWSKIAIFAPVRRSLSEYCSVCYGKSRMVKKFWRYVCTFRQYTNVTDGQTDGHRTTA